MENYKITGILRQYDIEPDSEMLTDNFKSEYKKLQSLIEQGASDEDLHNQDAKLLQLFQSETEIVEEDDPQLVEAENQRQAALKEAAEAKKAAEEAEQKRQQEEAARKQAEEKARQQEEEAKRKADEEEAKRKAEQEEAAKKEAEEKQRQEAEAKQKAEQEAEAKRKAEEEEAKRKAEEEEKAKPTLADKLRKKSRWSYPELDELGITEHKKSPSSFTVDGVLLVKVIAFKMYEVRR